MVIGEVIEPEVGLIEAIKMTDLSYNQAFEAMWKAEVIESKQLLRENPDLGRL